MELHIDKDRCIGAGQCVLHAEAVFDQDDDGLVEQVGGVDGHETEVRSAVDACPAQVLSVD
jgi:ferredoxin